VIRAERVRGVLSYDRCQEFYVYVDKTYRFFTFLLSARFLQLFSSYEKNKYVLVQSSSLYIPPVSATHVVVRVYWVMYNLTYINDVI